MRTFIQKTKKQSARSGMLALEVILSLSITFSFAMVMYVIGQEGCYRLYQFIAATIGSPVW